MESKRVKPDDGSTQSLGSMSETNFAVWVIGSDLVMDPHRS